MPNNARQSESEVSLLQQPLEIQEHFQQLNRLEEMISAASPKEEQLLLLTKLKQNSQVCSVYISELKEMNKRLAKLGKQTTDQMADLMKETRRLEKTGRAAMQYSSEIWNSPTTRWSFVVQNIGNAIVVIVLVLVFSAIVLTMTGAGDIFIKSWGAFLGSMERVVGRCK